MELYAALDVALEKTALCIVDRDGAVVLEANVASDPDAFANRLVPFRVNLVRLGLEAGPLSAWLVRGLQRHGFEAVLMETRHVRAALSARVAKTDRNDARGMADLLRMGWFRPVHIKSMNAREQLLTARSTLVRRLKDIENSVRGLLRGLRHSASADATRPMGRHGQGCNLRSSDSTGNLGSASCRPIGFARSGHNHR
jgi:transposase